MSGLTDNFTAEGWKAALTLSDCGELVEAERQRILAELDAMVDRTTLTLGEFDTEEGLSGVRGELRGLRMAIAIVKKGEKE